jgi:nitrogen fixation protein NifU and related proteins
MNDIIELLKKSGYSDKAIKYFIDKVNVGKINDPSARAVFTGPCGDTVEIFLKIKDNVITNAKFQATGCAGAFTSGSGLTTILKNKTLDEAEKINEKKVIAHLGEMPKQKFHCTSMFIVALRNAIKEYRKSQ